MDIQELKNLIIKTKPLKVLYVEDNEETRQQANKMLTNFFSNVDISIDGQEGLKQYLSKEKNYYDIVISDINMPNMNGTDMVRKIFEIDKTQKIIMITAYNDNENLDELKELNVLNYIHKPIKMDTLIQAIKKEID